MKVMRHMPVMVLALVVVVIVTVSICYWARTQTVIPLAEDLMVENVKINRRTATLIGVNVTNTGATPVSLVKVDMIKVQAKLIVSSKLLSPAMVIAPGCSKEVSLSFPLDPEGADYKIMVVTEAGSAAIHIFGYP